jgi:hypothetical protein
MKSLVTPYPATLAICVTAQMEPSFITEEKRIPNVGFIGIIKDAKPAKVMQSSILSFFKFLH